MGMKSLSLPITLVWLLLTSPTISQTIDLSRSDQILCDVEITTTGTLPDLFSDGKLKARFKIDYRDQWGLKPDNKAVIIRCLTGENCWFDESVVFENNDNCYTWGLWYCKSSLSLNRNNIMSGRVYGNDMGKNISSYSEALFEFQINITTGKVRYLSQISSRLLPFKYFPPIRRESFGACRHTNQR
jgi:hypothetical protein